VSITSFFSIQKALHLTHDILQQISKPEQVENSTNTHLNQGNKIKTHIKMKK